jgi:cobalt-zinc-cadmium efflux system protein
MAHHRKALAAVVGLNTAIVAVELAAGWQAGSLSLVMDGVHNFSDEIALIALYLAFVLPQGLSRTLLRSGNLFNSIGLVAVSALVLWQAVERLLDPLPVLTWVPVVVGLGAAAANWAIARLLWQPGRDNAAIRLAYLHNLGDAFASLAPVLAGVLVGVTGHVFFDPLFAAAIAAWIIISTMREVAGSRDELIWPQKIQCGHAESD